MTQLQLDHGRLLRTRDRAPGRQAEGTASADPFELPQRTPDPPAADVALAGPSDDDWRPLFLADWTDAIFLHFAVDPALLQPAVPFELDLLDGRAYVSLVAFTQRRLRPRLGGKLAAALSAPLASHPFLNVRTYVRHGSQRGICFLAEWIPNGLARVLGPLMYGLPYRLGRLSYRFDGAGGATGAVSTARGALGFQITLPQNPVTAPASDPLDRFLLERYAAYTSRRGVARRFRIRHAPWPQMRVGAQVPEHALVRTVGDWWARAELVSANYSPGVSDVEISPPERLRGKPWSG